MKAQFCRTPRVPRFAFAAALLLAALAAASGQAATYTWDAAGGGTTFDGNGAWNTSSTNWWNGSADTTWSSSANVAQFGYGTGGSSPYTVTLGAATTAAGIIFQNQNYTIAGGGNTLTNTSGSITLAGGSDTISAVLGGTHGLTEVGGGTLTLNPASVETYTGATAISGGVLALDFSNLSPATNLASTASALTLTGGALLVRGASSGATSQTLGNVTLAAGGSSILIDPNNGSGTTLALGSLAASTIGSNLLVGEAPGAGAGTATVTTKQNLGTHIFSYYIVYTNGTATGYDWAFSTSPSSPYTISAYNAYTTLTPAPQNGNYDLLLTSGGTTTITGNDKPTSLKIATSGASITLGLSSYQFQFNNGALLVTGTNSVLITSNSNNNNAISPAGTSQLLIQQYNTAGLTISAVISSGTLTKAGPGLLTLNAANQYNGATVLNGGTVNVDYGNSGGNPLGIANAAGSLLFNGGILQYSTSNQYDYSRRFSTAGNQQWLIDTNSQSVTFASVISGNGSSLTKLGAGALTLNAADTYTGNTTITAGTLGLGSAGQFPNGAGKGNVVFNTAGNAAVLSLNGYNATIGGLVQPSISNTNLVSSGSAAGTLTVGSNNATCTFGGVLTDGGGGALALTKTGAGILTLINTNSYSGGTTISAGVLSFAANSLGSGSITVNGGALQWYGNNTQDVSGQLAMVNGTSATFDTNGNSVTLGTGFGGGTSGALLKIGAGTLAIGGANTYSGGTTVSTGMLALLPGGSLGSGPATVNSGGTLAVASGGALGMGALTTINGGGILDVSAFGSGGYTFGSGTLAAGPTVPLGTDVNGSLNVQNATVNPLGLSGSGTMTINGNLALNNVTLGYVPGDSIAVGGGLTLAGTDYIIPTSKLSAGTTTLFTYTGTDPSTASLALGGIYGSNPRQQYAFTASGGVLTMSVSGLTGNLFWRGGSTGIWDTGTSTSWFNLSTGSADSFYTNDVVTFDDTAGTANGTVTINGTVSPASITVSNTAVAYAFSGTGSIIGAGGLTMNGPGTLTIGTSNTYFGGTTLNAGALNANAVQALGTGPLLMNGGTLTIAAAQAISSGTVAGGLLNANADNALGSGTLTITGGTLDNTSGGPVTLGNTTQNWNGDFTFGGSNLLNTGTGAITLGGNRVVTTAGTAALTVGGAISGTANLTLAGNGAVVLSAVNTFSGSTAVTGGTLMYGIANALPGNINVSGASSVLDLGGFSSTAGTVTLASGTIQDGTLTGTSFAVQNGLISAALAGTAALTMSGSGQATLSGNNSYSGFTNISGGALAITGTMGAGGYSMTGGTINFSGQQAISAAGSQIIVANGGGKPATLNITGGNLTNSATYGTIIGQVGGTGAMNVSGGAFTENVSGNMLIGNTNGTNSTGVLTISGSGSVVVNNSANYIYLGRGSTGSTGTINLNGGTLATGRSITQDPSQSLGTAVVNFNGGTLQALASNPAWISYITSANVQAGGACIDTNGQTMGIAQPLLSGAAHDGGLTKLGAGTLTLTTPTMNSYNGPTVIAAGTLKLAGSTGFDTWTVNNNNIYTTPVSGGTLTLTNNAGYEARSAFYPQQVALNLPFTVSYVFVSPTVPNPQRADGVAFVVQNSSAGANALGDAGDFGLAYATPAMTPSYAVILNLFSSTTVGTALATNATLPGSFTPVSPVNLNSTHPIQVNLSYDGSSNLVETLKDLTTSSTWSTTYTGINMASSGLSSAYIGFAGSTGGYSATQMVSNFSFNSAAASVSSAILPMNNILPTGTALSVAANGTLDLYGANQTVGSLSGAGTVTNSNVGTISILTAGGDGTWQTFSGTLQDGGGSLGLTKAGPGGLTLTGTNAYSGPTTISGGVLQAVDGVGLPSTSNLVFSGGLAQNGYGAVLQGSGTFSRALGTGPGQVQWTGDGGFAAKGGPLTVSIDNNQGDPLLWNYTPNFVGNGSVLTFGSSTADSQVNFTDSIDLTGGSRQIDVAAGLPGSSVLLSGDISDDIFGGASLTKTGKGTLILSGTNDYSGGTYLDAGKLVLLSSDAVPDGTNVTVGNASYFAPLVPASSSASAVPEPGTLLLLLTALLCGGRHLLRAGCRFSKRHGAK